MTKTRHVVRNLRLDEISSVDRPAQIGAVSVLMKRADENVVEVEYATICKSADAVVGGDKPAYSREAYEDAMFLRAEGLAKSDGISPQQALAKYLATDETLRKLAHASEVANAAEYAAGFRSRGRAAA